MSFEKTWDNIVGGGSGQRRAKKKAQMQAEQDRIDKVSFEKFKAQDMLDPDKELFQPTYQRNKQFEEAQEGILSLFNARKDQILAGRRTPGISQTRF